MAKTPAAPKSGKTTQTSTSKRITRPTGVQIPAPAGTIAVRRKVKLDNGLSALAKLVGGNVPVQHNLHCSYCNHNLTEYAETEGVVVASINYCPHCQAKLKDPTKVHCYRCSNALSDTGNCTTCRASVGDSKEQKAATVYVRIHQPGLSLVMLKTNVTALMGDEQTMPEVLNEVEEKKWISDVEEGKPLPFVGSPAYSSGNRPQQLPSHNSGLGWTAPRRNGGDDPLS